MPRAAATSEASCSSERSIPSSAVSLPPTRRTNDSPSTATLKLRLVMPPPSTSMSAVLPGQRRSTISSTSMRDPRHVRALLFDFNGTLSDDERLHCAIYQRLFAEHGRPLTEEQYFVELAGLSDFEIVERWLGPGHPAGRDVLAARVRLYQEAAGDGST